MEIGPILKRLRLERGLSGYGLAKAADLTPTQVKAIEDGTITHPRIDTLQRLALVLGVTTDELFGTERPIPAGKDHDAGRPENTVPVRVEGVAAGGAPIDSEDTREEYPLLRHLYRAGRYAIRLSGDSMWPTLWDKDLLLVEPADAIPNGRIAVVKIKGESTVKRVHRRKKDGSWTLKSDNPTYQMIEAEPDEVQVVARFLKIVEGERP